MGKNLDGARRLSWLTQFPRFNHKPRRPGDYRLHHVTTSRAHSVLQRPQQASATRGLLVVTGCAAVSFKKKAWQCAQNEPHLPVQSLWELKPDPAARFAARTTTGMSKRNRPPGGVFLVVCKSVVTCPSFPPFSKVCPCDRFTSHNTLQSIDILCPAPPFLILTKCVTVSSFGHVSL